ncbi:MAG: glucosidase [Polyangiales bacterium]
MPDRAAPVAEQLRLDEDRTRDKAWKRWGPYLADRQWATVREDYSADGDAWSYFPHDHARSRAYRWGEDGLLGLCDRQGRVCFALALWNGRDAILKERLFGLTGPQGNHGEDVKEEYFHADSTPTHSYMKAVYKYPQAPFPYEQLVTENGRRGRGDLELDLADTGIFEGGRYFDVIVEYAKASPDDVLVRVTIENHAPEPATIDVLPTLGLRNTWSWGRTGEGYWPKGQLRRAPPPRGVGGRIDGEHPSLGALRLDVEAEGELLFTENETNKARLFGATNDTPFVKDAFHRHVIDGAPGAVNPDGVGTKAASRHRLVVPAHGAVTLRLRLTVGDARGDAPFGAAFDRVFADRLREADEFYATKTPPGIGDDARAVIRRGYAGLLWSKQFYHYVVRDWLEGDPGSPPPPPGHAQGRNRDWDHLHCRDVISMPDKWEYPWFAAWDLAFHMVPFARIDPDFAKEQLILFLREWYMHPNGQVPAYEWTFSDVNPPVHAWAAWRVYKIAAERGERDHTFLARVFQKLIVNFTWWVNRKDAEGNNLFGGGFLGLDNVGVFDRSKPLPVRAQLAQADGTAWMAFYCTTMLEIALELARVDPAYEDMASKFFEHFVAITDAMNTLGGTGLWDEADGFYYDQLVFADSRATMPLRLRSMVGIIPLFAAGIIEQEDTDRLPGFWKRTRWFLENRTDLARHISYMAEGREVEGHAPHGHRLLAIPSKERLVRVLGRVLDEDEFLAPYGVRSLSKAHSSEHPYVLQLGAEEFRVQYTPGESDSGLFGGNSNWRGPVWLPVNYLLLEALERYHHFYGDTLQIECPTGSGRFTDLKGVAREIGARVAKIFLPDARDRRPFWGEGPQWKDPSFAEHVLFHEYFDPDTGRGCGASHQTGWTALVVRLLEKSGDGR